MKKISPHDLIAHLGIDGLNRTADEYYRRIKDFTPHITKPFNNAKEAPVLLYNLGLLLGGLKLAPGMKVLDFGCGVGWLGRYLLQMDCDVCFLDVSETALKQAADLLTTSPPLGQSTFPRTASFERFNGKQLPLANDSVDRIASFAAFHHTANPNELIEEFARVLTPGGVVGFYEPGLGHSQTGQSQHEMREYGALENDLDLRTILETGDRVGLTRSSFHFSSDPKAPFDADTFFELIDREVVNSSIAQRIAQTTRSSYVFFLSKGDLALDSRQVSELSGALESHSPRETHSRDGQFEVALVLRNTGRARWLASAHGGIGIVKVGVHLSAVSGDHSDHDFSRFLLPHDVMPGTEVFLRTQLNLPGPGEWKAVFDLVSEGIAWFEALGSAPLEFRVFVG